MAKREHIVSYTVVELKALAAGEAKSDWAAAKAMSDEALEAAITSDDDEAGLEFDWSQPLPEPPKPKAVLNMRVDAEVMEFIRGQGRGYQTKINAVLRNYVDRMKSRA